MVTSNKYAKRQADGKREEETERHKYSKPDRRAEERNRNKDTEINTRKGRRSHGEGKRGRKGRLNHKHYCIASLLPTKRFAQL